MMCVLQDLPSRKEQYSMANVIAEYKNYNNVFFAKWAKLYDYEKYVLFSLRRKVTRFLNLPVPQKILDVATGTGAQAYEGKKFVA